MIRIADFTRWVSGTACGAVPEFFEGAAIDSRAVPQGGLFVALKGEKVDGHDFVLKAIRGGAAAAMVREDWSIPGDDGLPLIKVKDVAVALREGAKAYRNTLSAKVVGITGSAGKTTVKELTKAFLSTIGKTHATAGNYNNDLGLPLTVLNCPADAQFLVTEMGTNHPGEIAALVDIAHPDIGLISSIGTAHIEFFKTQDGIAQEKGTLFARLSGNGSFAVMSSGNDRYAKLLAMCSAPVVTVSNDDPDAEWIRKALADRIPGEHNVSNAMIAWGCASRLGATRDACEHALAEFELPGQRWKRIVKGGITFIADCYNANPTSMVVSLETFAKERHDGRKVAVLGDMFELGDQSEVLHEMVKKTAAALPLDKVIYVGSAFGGGSLDDAAKELRDGDLVLLKASHGMHLEKILD